MRERDRLNCVQQFNQREGEIFRFFEQDHKYLSDGIIHFFYTEEEVGMNIILQNRAKQLRANMTEEEVILWQALRAKRFLNTKFKRQQVLGNYIVDFVSFSAKLIIEIDGSQHLEQLEYDQKRTFFLNSLGFEVLRFWNYQIHSELEIVLDKIFYTLNERYSPSL